MARIAQNNTLFLLFEVRATKSDVLEMLPIVLLLRAQSAAVSLLLDFSLFLYKI